MPPKFDPTAVSFGKLIACITTQFSELYGVSVV